MLNTNTETKAKEKQRYRVIKSRQTDVKREKVC